MPGIEHQAASHSPSAGVAATPSIWARRISSAVDDLIVGVFHWELWSTLAWHDIRQRYRRSVIGPFWLSLSMGATVGALGFVFSTIFQQSVPDYIPYLSLGLIVWGLISAFILEACDVFTSATGIIRQLRMPLSVHVYRMIARNYLIFVHNIVIYVVIIVVFEIWPGAAALLALPGLLLLGLNGISISVLLGVFGTRFRDLQPIVTSVVQVIFFITPIFWKGDQLAHRPVFVAFNPFAYMIDIVRMPLLGEVPPLSTWLVVLAITIAGQAVAFAFFARFRARVAYWL
jgi:homopolymeric O-antigen transport system permease protein